MTQWRIRDVMTTEVITMPAGVPVAEIAAVLTEHQISGVPIVDRFDVVVGILSWKDLFKRIETDVPDAGGRGWWRRQRLPVRWSADTAAEVMSAAPVTIGRDTPLAAAGRLMHRKKHSRLLDVDGRHRLLGIVTRTDLLKVHARLDAVIEDEVKERVLRRTLLIDPGGVRVAVDDGVVTLWGNTVRRTSALAAAALAERFPASPASSTTLPSKPTTPSANRRPDRPYRIRFAAGGPLPGPTGRPRAAPWTVDRAGSHAHTAGE